MTTEQEERVAKAICEAEGNTPDAVSPYTMEGQEPPPLWQDYLTQARIFIAASAALSAA